MRMQMYRNGNELADESENNEILVEDDPGHLDLSIIEKVGHHGEIVVEGLGHHCKTIAEELGHHHSHEETGTMMGWFSMSRKDGGPTSYSNFPFSYSTLYSSSDITICCFAFSIPLISFLILLPSFRKKHWPSVLVVFLCILTGLGLISAYVSSSWLIGETEIKMPVGPKRPPIKSLVGMWVGLWHANLTYITPELYLNHMITWADRSGMSTFHKTALEKGWPLALVSLTAEISGESLAWRGLLGDGIYFAGSMASYPLIAAIYSWAVWVLIFFVAPELTCQPLIVTGILMALSALAYIGCGVYYFPAKFIIGGTLIKLKLGWAWWLIGSMSIILTIVGGILLIYDRMYPGRVAAMFKVDFYCQSDCILQAAEILSAFEASTETYSEIYPLSLSYLWYGNKITNPKQIHKSNKDETVEKLVDTKSTNKGSLSSENNTRNNSNLMVEYVNETEKVHKTKTQMDESSDTSIVVASDADYTFCKSESLTRLRKRTPPEKVPSKMSACSEPVLTETTHFATIRKSKTMPRHFSVPTIIPQVSPKYSGGSHKKSLSRIHSKFRPNYSPRKPSMVSLISLPKLELEEISENVTPL